MWQLSRPFVVLVLLSLAAKVLTEGGKTPSSHLGIGKGKLVQPVCTSLTGPSILPIRDPNWPYTYIPLWNSKTSAHRLCRNVMRCYCKEEFEYADQTVGKAKLDCAGHDRWKLSTNIFVTDFCNVACRCPVTTRSRRVREKGMRVPGRFRLPRKSPNGQDWVWEGSLPFFPETLISTPMDSFIG